MRDLNVTAEQLFNEIRGRFPSVTIGDADGNVTNEPSQARFYEFDFKSLDNVLGKVSVTLDEKSGVTIMYNKDFTEDVGYTEQEDWYNFLKGMRVFAKKRLLNFEVRDINKSNFTQRDYSYMATNRGETKMNESALRGTDKTSFQKIGNAKLRIKHTGLIGEGESRTKKIGSLFIENAEGEKFKYPFKHLSGARAMAIHVSEGGHPFDDFGKHITGLSEELSNLRKFKTYMGRSSVMAESLAEHMDTVNERIATVKKTVQNLQKVSNYKTAFESFEPSDSVEVPDEVAENWIDQLTVKQFNEELKDVFPYIYRLVGESTKAQEMTFEDIINEVDKASVDAAVKQAMSSAPATSPRPKMRPPMSSDVFPSEQAAIDDALANGYKQPGVDFEVVPSQGRMFAWRQIGNDINIGAGANRGPEGEVSTRGVSTESQIDMAFDKLLGQFADNFTAQVEGDVDEGNAYAKAVRMAKFKGAKKGDEIDGPDGEKITLEKDQKTPLGEFILSYYDRATGQFPKGETAVLTSVEKDYGDQYVKPASQFIERLGQVYEKYQTRKMAEMGIEEGDDLGLQQQFGAAMKELFGTGPEEKKLIAIMQKHKGKPLEMQQAGMDLAKADPVFKKWWQTKGENSDAGKTFLKAIGVGESQVEEGFFGNTDEQNFEVLGRDWPLVIQGGGMSLEFPNARVDRGNTEAAFKALQALRNSRNPEVKRYAESLARSVLRLEQQGPNAPGIAAEMKAIANDLKYSKWLDILQPQKGQGESQELDRISALAGLR